MKFDFLGYDLEFWGFRVLFFGQKLQFSVVAYFPPRFGQPVYFKTAPWRRSPDTKGMLSCVHMYLQLFRYRLSVKSALDNLERYYG